MHIYVYVCVCVCIFLVFTRGSKHDTGGAGAYPSESLGWGNAFASAGLLVQSASVSGGAPAAVNPEV